MDLQELRDNLRPRAAVDLMARTKRRIPHAGDVHEVDEIEAAGGEPPWP